MKVKLLLICLMFTIFQELLAQKSTVSGKVIDSSGEPIIGVSVMEIGTTNGTMTTATGEFSLEISKPNARIRISSVGYKSQDLDATSSPITVTLANTDSQLDEFIVTGYSVQKRGNVTASIATVDSKSLKQTATSPSVGNLLQGKVAGVDVISSSGRPGSMGNIRIRGRATISSNQEVLWVVDGVIAHGTPNINPNDVESISVLKDGAATTQYGSRGVNGVIVVTTKRPQAGKGQISVNLKTGSSTLNQGKFKLMNSQQLYDYFQTFKNIEQVPSDITSAVTQTNNDWVKNGTQAGKLNDLSIAYSGRTEKTSLYAGANYYSEEGSVRGYTYDRLATRINLDYNISKNLVFKPKINATYTSDESREHSLYQMYLNLPWDNPYNAAGKPFNPQTAGLKWWGRDQSNYLFDLQYNYGKSNIFDIQTNMDFDYSITKNLSFISTNNIAFYTSDGMSYADPQSISGAADAGRINNNAAKRIVRFTNQMLRYTKSIDKHTIGAFAAYEYGDYMYQGFSATGKGIVPGSIILDAASSPISTTGTKNEYATQSGMIQGTYSFDDRYNLQASFRRDGSSRFGENKRYGNFYSVSGAWNIHNESWLKNDILNVLRLKASYGLVGNVPTALYGSYDLFSLTGQYNGTPAATMSNLGNPNLTWETSRDVNLGLEAGVWNRVNVSLDVYNKNTNGLLHFVVLPSTAGWSGYYYNIGAVRNKGIEFTLGVDVLGKESPVSWHINFNIAKNINRIKELIDGKEQAAGNKRYAEGRDIDSWYMRKWAGVNPDNGDPQWEVKNSQTGEITLTNNYNLATLQYVGTSTPKNFGGLSSSVEYKGISLSVNFAFNNGALAYNAARELFDADGAYPYYNQILLKDDWSRWTPQNTNATHPVLVYNSQNGSNKTSSRYLEDASFIKMRNITLGYRIPASLTNKIKSSGIDLYVAGDNLWTKSDFSGIDPEAALYGDATSQYPFPKRVTFGINFNF